MVNNRFKKEYCECSIQLSDPCMFCGKTGRPIKIPKLCKCSHSHISWVGNEKHPDGHYEKIDECEMCNCEKFVEIKK